MNMVDSLEVYPQSNGSNSIKKTGHAAVTQIEPTTHNPDQSLLPSFEIAAIVRCLSKNRSCLETSSLQRNPTDGGWCIEEAYKSDKYLKF